MHLQVNGGGVSLDAETTLSSELYLFAYAVKVAHFLAVVGQRPAQWVEPTMAGQNRERSNLSFLHFNTGNVTSVPVVESHLVKAR